MFINETKPKVGDNARPGDYGFDGVPKLLFSWSRLFQSVVSQAGTFLLTGKFHNTHCAIYKSEGGCHIAGVGDVVLGKRGCYFDFWRDNKSDKQVKKIADLITHVVIKWNPMQPIDSMLNAAAEFLKESVRDCPDGIEKELKTAIEKSSNGGPFGGDALSNFFDWNPFSRPPVDRDYLRYCLINFSGATNEEVDQKFADEDLGEDLLERINAEIKKREPNSYKTALCCSPRRQGNELSFWVNTGRSTQIDGWRTQDELERFINTENEKLVDTE